MVLQYGKQLKIKNALNQNDFKNVEFFVVDIPLWVPAKTGHRVNFVEHKSILTHHFATIINTIIDTTKATTN